MLVYFAVILAGYIVITVFTDSDSTYVSGLEELYGFDYSSDIAYISEYCFDWYPGALYTPEDFASGAVTQPPAQDDGGAGYYTYRLTLPLEAGKVYGLSGNSATYAQSLWVDGELLSSVGVPGDSLESMTPGSWQIK